MVWSDSMDSLLRAALRLFGILGLAPIERPILRCVMQLKCSQNTIINHLSVSVCPFSLSLPQMFDTGDAPCPRVSFSNCSPNVWIWARTWLESKLKGGISYRKDAQSLAPTWRCSLRFACTFALVALALALEDLAVLLTNLCAVWPKAAVAAVGASGVRSISWSVSEESEVSQSV